ncbi:MAG: nucleotide exchange factor GrpE [Verrucomicrobiota bacterium]|jgi:molecular chaperone GrpE|nr:nucleotide exchange factor GrpE [Verrucomicrobiota bacterium]
MSKESEDKKPEISDEIANDKEEVRTEPTQDTEAGVDSSEVVEEEASPVTVERKAWDALEAKGLKADENWDRFLRLNAEFDNFKKRSARERAEAVKYANEALLERLIPTLDHFEMAMAAVHQAQDESMSSIKMGIEMVHNQLKATLKESGLEEVDALGKVFDPAWHEAVSQKETDKVPEGQVIEQARKGYKLNDRLIRPANVVVAKAISDEGSAGEAS